MVILEHERDAGSGYREINMPIKRLSGKELLWLTLPTIGLLTLPLTLSVGQGPPVVGGIYVTPIKYESWMLPEDTVFDTEFSLFLELRKSVREHLTGGDESELDIVSLGFFDQNGKPVPVKTGDWIVSGLDLYFDFDLLPQPKSIKQLKLKMNLRVDDKWTIPVSTIVYKRS